MTCHSLQWYLRTSITKPLGDANKSTKSKLLSSFGEIPLPHAGIWKPSLPVFSSNSPRRRLPRISFGIKKGTNLMNSTPQRTSKQTMGAALGSRTPKRATKTHSVPLDARAGTRTKKHGRRRGRPGKERDGFGLHVLVLGFPRGPILTRSA